MREESRGLVSLAFALDDAALKDRSAKWVDAFLRSQREDGDFGPKLRNWWANMIALWTLRDWCDAPGRAVDPPCSPMSEADCAEAEVISLVPLSETQIRITLFPWLWADD